MDFVFGRSDRRPAFFSPWNTSQLAAERMNRLRYNRRVKPFVDDSVEPVDRFFEAIEGRRVAEFVPAEPERTLIPGGPTPVLLRR
jgi:hypothetical protein